MSLKHEPSSEPLHISAMHLRTAHPRPQQCRAWQNSGINFLVHTTRMLGYQRGRPARSCLPGPVEAIECRYRAVEPEQWLQRHPEAGSSWPSWPKASHPPHLSPPHLTSPHRSTEYSDLFRQDVRISHPSPHHTSYIQLPLANLLGYLAHKKMHPPRTLP